MSRLCALLLLPIVICLSACTQPSNPEPSTAWMEVRHPGPYVTVTVPGGESERCLSCHDFTELSTISSFLPTGLQASEGESDAFEADALHPGNTHPGGWLAWHDYNETGCIVCHGGDGSGTSYAAARHADMFDNGHGLHGLTAEASRELGCGGCHAGELLPGAPLLSQGRALIRELNCSACHALPDWLAGGDAGPDLGRSGQKYPMEILATLPNNVQHYKPGSRMPQYELTAQQAADIAVFISGGLTPTKDQQANTAVAVLDVEAMELLATLRCINCHALPVLPAEFPLAELPPDVRLLWELPQGSIGPSLARAGERLSAAWIADFLLDTHAWYPHTRMPQYELNQQQAELLAGWLTTAGIVPGNPAPVSISLAGDPVEGEAQFIAQGCAGCHEISGRSLSDLPIGPTLQGVASQPRELWQGKAPQAASLADYITGNLADPPAVGNPRMPRIELSEQERLAIAVALLAEPAAGTVRTAALREAAGPAMQPLKSDWQAYWAYPVPPQGSGDPQLSRLERDLHPESCAVCHRQQYADWQGTRHSLAMGPGILGQIVDMDSANYSSCLKCHAVLSEQLHVRKLDGNWQDNPDYREDLYLTGISCASCHVRAHTRYAAEESRQQYPWSRTDLSAHPLERTPLLESSDFCWNCHQFDESRTIADGNPPLQNTNVEHRDWKLATGDTRSCQDCHLPEGRHTFKGIHDADFVRDSLDISAAIVTGPTGRIARISIHTRDVGHYFPTYVTPAVFVELQLQDAAGNTISDSLQTLSIQRDARTRRDDDGKSQWYDHADTRLPPGSLTELEFELETVALATHVLLLITVEPDHFYHNSYGSWTADESRSEAGRGLLEQARQETSREASGYVLFETSLALD